MPRTDVPQQRIFISRRVWDEAVTYEDIPSTELNEGIRDAMEVLQDRIRVCKSSHSFSMYS